MPCSRLRTRRGHVHVAASAMGMALLRTLAQRVWNGSSVRASRALPMTPDALRLLQSSGCTARFREQVETSWCSQSMVSPMTSSRNASTTS